MEEQGQSITVVPMQPCHIEELERLVDLFRKL